MILSDDEIAQMKISFMRDYMLELLKKDNGLCSFNETSQIAILEQYARLARKAAEALLAELIS